MVAGHEFMSSLEYPLLSCAFVPVDEFEIELLDKESLGATANSELRCDAPLLFAPLFVASS
jgi:hypothetical protein